MPTPIGTNDVVSVQGRHLYKANGDRFFMKGVAFPDAPWTGSYNATNWNKILHQLNDLELEYNTVRMYRMDPEIDYSEFFNEAAKLGIYVVVPLTGVSGDGDLSRTHPAPECYPERLFEYGKRCLRNFMQYPNVLAGLVGNEVMNSVITWWSAPCVKSYVHDLKLFMRNENDRLGRSPLPLLYAAQNTGIGAAIDPVEAMKMTADYLTCSTTSDTAAVVSSPKAALLRRDEEYGTWPEVTKVGTWLKDEDEDLSSIDIFGINIESYCGSNNTFLLNDDGTTGTYYSLWKGLHDTSIPLVFTEMGCSHNLFDKGNSKDGARDWAQVPIVLHDMADTFSGFSAYAYYGNSEFNMFGPSNWNGHDVLEPTDDFYNFRAQLKEEAENGDARRAASSSAKSVANLTITPPPTCKDIETQLHWRANFNLYEITDMPTYAPTSTTGTATTYWLWAGCIGLIGIVTAVVVKRCRVKRSSSAGVEMEHVSYQTIP